jgi:hypothetical protein
MAPEQADGLDVDARADLFSLGCVLYRMAAGRPAFAGDTLTALLRAVAEHNPRPVPELNPSIPADLAALILRLLAKDPAKRPASAREVVATLGQMPPAGAPLPPTVPFVPPNVRRGRQLRKVLGIAAGLVLVVGCVMLWFLTRPGPAGTTRGTDPGNPPEAPVARKGSVNILIWRGPDEAAQKLRLGEEGALPLYRGDKFRIEAHAGVPAYLYLFWVKAEGQVLPVYPWTPGKWGTRPAAEEPVRDVSLPKTKTNGYPLSGEQEGMETLLLLARETPLPLDDAALQKLFAGIGPQRPIQNQRSAVWFENGKVVEGDPRRQRDYFDTEVGLNDPVLRLQALIEERLQPRASFTSAVSFARLGEKK